jgi:predicted PurR-regulated permease PerM
MGIVAGLIILYIGKSILMPIVFSIIMGLLLNPAVNYLCSKKINRIVSIFLVVTISMILLLALSYFIISQISLFAESFPMFQQKFALMYNDFIGWISQKFNVSKPHILTWVDDTTANGINNSSSYLGTAIAGVGDMLVFIFLIPVYIFMILFYKPQLIQFISKLFKDEDQFLVLEVFTETKSIISKYLIGLLIQALIVAILNYTGLLIIGIQYALLIGVLGALLNFIPYIGGIIAIAMPVLIAVATNTPMSVFWVLVLYATVQLIDNNFLVPKIVGSKVKVNALASIVGVLVGGAIWGIAGMFLAIPILAICKVIFDRIPSMQPIGFLIGDTQPEIAHQLLKKLKRV